MRVCWTTRSSDQNPVGGLRPPSRSIAPPGASTRKKDMNRTMEDTASYWLELVVDDSYNEDMSAGEFHQTSRLLIDLLNGMIRADKAIDAMRASR